MTRDNDNTPDPRKTIAIYSQRLCGKLLDKGFPILAMDKNRELEGKNVFIFKYSEELGKVIEEYKAVK